LNLNDTTSLRRFARHLERVLILEPQPASARLLTELLKDLGAARVYVEPTAFKAMAVAKSEEPDVIFTEFSGPGLDGLVFTRQLRRSDFRCRKAPVIMATSEATAAAIMGARDCGVHEFLRKPFNLKDLVRRIEAVTLKPRDWVEAVQYVGPDRRRFNSGDYKGPKKRKADAAADTHAMRIEQALRIVKSALPAIASDPAQAMRAMMAQAENLTKTAVDMGDTRLATGAAALTSALKTCAAQGRLDRQALEAVCQPLWAYLPAGDVKAA